MELLTAAQMREIEQAAIASGAVTGLELMERAGRGVVEAIWEEWPELRAVSGRAVVLCGPGNNGGDGFVVARLLKDWGWEVEVFLYGDAEQLPPDARVNYERWGEMGEVRPLTEEGAPSGQSLHCDVFVDALFGIGLSRPLHPALLKWIGLVQGRHVAIDVPSGLDSDSGAVLAATPSQCATDLTVTFEAPKLGHYLHRGPAVCGRTVVKPIGIVRPGNKRWIVPEVIALGSASTVRLFDLGAKSPMVRRQLAKGPNGMPVPADHHKFSYGSAFVLSGRVGRGGAARLAARGALRIGVGLVTVGCPPSALMENASALDAIMVRRVEDGAALAALLEADARIKALCLGPGMGTGAREAGLVAAALDGRKDGGLHPPYVCLDADALTLLAGDAALFGRLQERCVLTPHAGEFSRLFPDIAEKLAEPPTTGPAYSKVDATREAAKRAGCVVLFKGPDTVIAAPDGRCAINAAVYDRAAPWLATAGSGDVLAGFITGLLARGFAPMQAAETGAWLHVECARSFGPGLIAEDLPKELPKVFRELGGDVNQISRNLVNIPKF